ncbi:Pkinase-domain-containing protein [Flagelloscypha sp. PMI_526]|nr:Pkinase-domain-containing protein [Flagelloscypha sp. PMI_526]
MTSTTSTGADTESSAQPPDSSDKPPKRLSLSSEQPVLPPPHDDSLNTSVNRSPSFARGTLKATLEGRIDPGILNQADTPTGGMTPALIPGTPNLVPSSPAPKSRAPSFSGSKPKDVPVATAASKDKSSKKVANPSPNPNNFASNAYLDQQACRESSRAFPAKSEDGDGGKHSFRLKDLLANGPKLNRRSSNKSTKSIGSGKSDSDINEVEKYHGPPKSEAGQSVGSLNSKYGICQKVAIGRGATSVVRLAHKWDRKEEKLYAVKEFRKRRKNESEKEYVKKLTAEFCISSTLHHTNIVETVDLVQDENQKWCEVMEFCPGGDLYAAIKKGGMSPAEVECCFKQILKGVEYLHKQGVAHRDLKPENLFFDVRGRLKIGDYGASTVYRLPWESTIHMSTGLCGSEPYIAPEQFLHKPYDARLVDIWAVGIVYYCLHFQELPWRAAQASDEMFAEYEKACLVYPVSGEGKEKEGTSGKGEGTVKEKHGSHGNAVPGCPPTINNLSPRACRPLIRHMLEPDPKKRASIDDVIQYTWYKSIPICFDQEEPGHIHVNAKSMANLVVKEVYE